MTIAAGMTRARGVYAGNGAEVQVNGGGYVSGAGGATVAAGDTLQLRMTTSASLDTEKTATVRVGSRKVEWTTRTAPNLIYVTDATAVNEGQTLEFVVSLAQAAASDITFDWITYDGTAYLFESGSAVGDYGGVTLPVTATIGTGQSQVTIDITANDDIYVEPTESFQVSLVSATGAGIIDDLASGSILDTDFHNPTPTIVGLHMEGAEKALFVTKTTTEHTLVDLNPYGGLAANSRDVVVYCDGFWTVGGNDGLGYRSSDLVNWSIVTIGGGTPIQQLDCFDDVMLASRNGSSYHRSTDGGLNWSSVAEVVGDGNFEEYRGRIWTTSGTGDVKYSDDQGVSFTTIGSITMSGDVQIFGHNDYLYVFDTPGLPSYKLWQGDPTQVEVFTIVGSGGGSNTAMAMDDRVWVNFWQRNGYYSDDNGVTWNSGASDLSRGDFGNGRAYSSHVDHFNVSDNLSTTTRYSDVFPISGDSKGNPVHWGGPTVDPDAFTIPTMTDVALNTQTESAIITVSGLTIPQGVWSGNGTDVRVNGGSYVDGWGAATVTDGDTFQIRMLSPNAFSTMKTSSIYLGTREVEWTIETVGNQIFITDAATVNEGQTLEFVITLSQAATGDITFDWLTVDGSAVSIHTGFLDGDYTPQVTAQPATIANGELGTTIYVEAIDDQFVEDPETVSVSLSNLVGAGAGDLIGFGTITSPDEHPTDIRWVAVNPSRTILMTSTDGETYSYESTEGLLSSGVVSGYIKPFDYCNGTWIFAGTNTNLLKTSDFNTYTEIDLSTITGGGGETFESVHCHNDNWYVLRVSPGGGMNAFRSTDGGDNWSGIMVGDNISLRQMTQSDGRLYTSGNNGRVAVSDDNGVSWDVVTISGADWLSGGAFADNGRVIVTGNDPSDNFYTASGDFTNYDTVTYVGAPGPGCCLAGAYVDSRYTFKFSSSGDWHRYTDDFVTYNSPSSVLNVRDFQFFDGDLRLLADSGNIYESSDNGANVGFVIQENAFPNKFKYGGPAIEPDLFSIPEVLAVDLSVTITSAPITISGMTVDQGVWAGNGAEARINAGSWENGWGGVTVNTGDILELRMVSGAALDTRKVSSVRIGNRRVDWATHTFENEIFLDDPLAVVEGETLQFIATLAGPAGSNIEVEWSTSSSQATPGVDYTTVTNQSATIFTGQSQVTLPVITTDDSDYEIDEILNVDITITGGSVNVIDGSAVGTILNDDCPATGWCQQAYVKSINSDAGDAFGKSLAISDNTMAVGAFNEYSNQSSITNGTTASSDNSFSNSGAVYVYNRNSGTWVQEAYIKASNAGANDLFGHTLDLDGDTLVVGADDEDSNQTTITNGPTASTDDSASNSGAVYVFSRTGGTWAQTAYIKSPTGDSDEYGRRIAFKGDTLIVGAYRDDSSQDYVTNGTGAPVDSGADSSGAAYVYRRYSGTWVQEAYLKSSNLTSFDFFGGQVATDGNIVAAGSNSDDSNQTFVTNGNDAPENNSAFDSGAVFLFEKSGGSWQQTAFLKASNSQIQDRFGDHMAVDGDLVVVGAPYEDSNQTTVTNGNGSSSDNTNTDSGAAYVFGRVNGTWVQQAYLKPSNNTGDDRFGSYVSIHGDRIAVGSPREDSNEKLVSGTASGDDSFNSSGAVYLYERVAGNWTQTNYIKAPNAQAEDQFGSIVDNQGDYIVVGAHLEDSDQRGITNAPRAETNDNAASSGAVYVFKYTGGVTPYISQASTQEDPANQTPIEWDVEFSKEISAGTFTTADISLHAASTASGITWNIVNSGDNRNFTLQATAVSTIGIIKPAVIGGGITDVDGSVNVASTSVYDDEVTKIDNPCDTGDLDSICVVSGSFDLSTVSSLSGSGDIVFEGGSSWTTAQAQTVTIVMGGNISIMSGANLYGNYEFHSQDFILQWGATIDGDGMGYEGSAGGPPGQGPGGSGDYKMGAGHGGAGGISHNTTETQGMGTYGSYEAPVEFGSGGYIYSNPGTNGGGRLQVMASGNAQIYGDVYMRGIDSVDATCCAPSAGSGGSIYINVGGDFEGSGVLNVKGGSADGNNGAAAQNGAAGGGGRIALVKDFDGSGSFNFGGNINVNGGNSYRYATAGFPGTYYTNAHEGDRLCDTGSLDTTCSVFQNKSLPTFQQISGNGSLLLSFAAISIVGDGAVTINLGNDFAMINNSSWNGDVASFNVAGSISISEPFIGDVDVITGKEFDVDANFTGNIHNSNFEFVNIASGVTLSAAGRGYSGSEIAGSGYGPGGSSYATLGSSGASHGGLGAQGNNGASVVGEVYGSESYPTQMGSGGAASERHDGGDGGGKIHLVATGAVTINGVIDVSGTRGGGNTGCCANHAAGGGAGGSILIEASDVIGSGNLMAVGGDGRDGYADRDGGAGGGGRIALLTQNTLSWAGSHDVSGGTGTNVTSAGSAGTYYTGSTGSIQLQFASTGQSIDENFRDAISDNIEPMASGNNLACAIGEDRKIYCWGSNAAGATGQGTTTGDTTSPSEIVLSGTTQDRFLQVAGYEDTFCGLGVDHKAYCWGAGPFGQLGHGVNVANVSNPVEVLPGASDGYFKSVHPADQEATCALGLDQKAYCWGADDRGLLGDGGASGGDVSIPVAVVDGEGPGVYKALRAGARHMCAIGIDDKGYCWGGGFYGRLGDGGTSNQDEPQEVHAGDSPGTFKQISAGNGHSCGIGTDDKLYCWGRQFNGRLGNGTGVDANITTPIQVSLGEGPATYKFVSSANEHSCAIGTDDKAYCWGKNRDGQIGNGSTSDQFVPGQVHNGESTGSFKRIFTGDDEFTCAIGVDDGVYCWGDQTNGRTGDGNTSGDQTDPEEILVGDNSSGNWMQPNNFSFDLVLSAVSNVDITVPWSAAGTATYGLDHQVAGGTAVFPAGITKVRVNGTILDDNIGEQDETIIVNLGAPSSGVLGLNGQHVVTILDDDFSGDGPYIFITDPLANEGDDLVYTIFLSEPAPADVSVDFTTMADTASTADFEGQTGSALIPAGNQATQVVVKTLQDSASEADESVLLSLSAAVNADLVDNIGNGTILDDENTNHDLYISDASSVAEGETIEMVFWTGNAVAPVSDIVFEWSTFDGTALETTDYVGVTSQLATLGAGEYAVTLLIPTVEDGVYEEGEYFTVFVSSVSSGNLRDPLGVAPIYDDDGGYTVTFSGWDAGSTEGEVMEFNISFSSALTVPVVLMYNSLDGTAVNGADFVDVNWVYTTVAAGAEETRLLVNIVDDGIIESTETFDLEVFGVGIQPTAGITLTGTITNSAFKCPETGWCMKAFIEAEGADAFDYFGQSVVQDMDFLLVGAHQEDSDYEGVLIGPTSASDDGSSGSGAAYLFERTGGTWEQTAYFKGADTDDNDQYGKTVAKYGDYIAVAAPNEESNSTAIINGSGGSTNNSLSNVGAVYVYSKTSGTWAQEAYLKAGNSGDGDQFGWHIDMDGDTLVVGAPFEDSNSTAIINGTGTDATNGTSSSGAVYVYRRTAGTWEQEAFVKVSAATSNDYFGETVEIDRDRMAVGGSGAQAVAIFQRTGNTWAETQLISGVAGSGDDFSEQMKLHGDTLIVGAESDDSDSTVIINGTTTATDNNGTDIGAVYVYKHNGTSFEQEAYIKPGQAIDNLLFSQEMSLYGDRFAVATRESPSTATGIFNGSAVPTDANTGTRIGAVYVYRRTDSSWVQEAFIKSYQNEDDDEFGRDVHLYGDDLAVGSGRERVTGTGIINRGEQPDNTGSKGGAVFMYEFQGSPDVYIRPARYQLTSTAVLPIKWDVVFSKPIAAGTFHGSDIELDGASTASGVVFEVVNNGDDRHFTLKAVSVGVDGTVIPKLAAGQVRDLENFENNESSDSFDSTVTKTSTCVSTGLIGHWTFEGDYTDNAGDNDGVAEGDVTIVSGGKVGSAASFDGTGDGVDLGSDSSLDNLSTFSVCAWIKTSTYGLNTYPTIFDKSSSGNNGWNFYLNSINDDLSLYTGESGYREQDAIVTDNNWHHVCGTWDGTDGAGGIKVYLNGSEATSGGQNGDLGGTLNDAAFNLTIGNSGNNNEFTGLIDDARLYNVELNSTDISNIYNSGNGCQ